ncbi:POK9 protein, partial [Leucopsar rothschildi]|nr:POK9 protein [Leucopsar rothschildi]
SGSLGLDLAVTVDVTLIDNRPQKVPTGVKGPLIIGGQAHGALLGWSSSSMKGLFVLPGHIDVDYNGEICIMAQTHFPPMYIPKGRRIAQLVPMQQLTVAMTPANKEEQGVKGFGSMGGLALLTPSMENHPVVNVVIMCGQQTLYLPVLLDPGSDLTII